MPLDPAQSAQTGTFIQRYSAAQQVSTKDGAWEIINRAMNFPAFQPYLPDGFVPETVSPVVPEPTPIQAQPGFAEMFAAIEVAHRAGDSDVLAFLQRLNPSITPSLTTAAATQAVVTRTQRAPKTTATTADSGAEGAQTETARVPMAPRPVSYVLSTDPGTVIEARSWRVLYANLLGMVLAFDPIQLATFPKGWFKDQDNVYNTPIPGGTGSMAYAFTCLKVDETERRCKLLLNMLGADLSVSLKDGSVVTVTR